MSDKKEELIAYLDACMEYELPINRFTYLWFRLSMGYTFRDIFKSIKKNIVNIKYLYASYKAYRILS